ncbi:MAG: thermonuclease family protein [Desulfobacca sp.]|uniref:thermonuclease family protein n=1 Tax=Desulfobacca sp. TaxID=2067990 RepID=UPI00404904B7
MQKNYGSWGKYPPKPALLLVILWALCLAAGCPAPSGPPATGLVAQVKDGDSIVLSDGREVRYLGIDTLELTSREPRELTWARQAKQVNAELVQGVKLRLEYDVERYDQYNRLLAYVRLPDGQLLNVILVRRGLARVLLTPPNLRYRAELIQAQNLAIDQRLGIWQELPQAQESHYVGNARSLRFHRPNCPGAQKINPANRRFFATPLEAYRQGYSPAKDCRP